MELTAAEIEAIGVAREVAANKRMKAPGFVGDAAAYERDANRRAKLNVDESGRRFTSAADYEIDANRRARRAGFKNAALKENPAAAAPGESIYSTDPFIDPRTGVSTQFSYPQTGGTTTGETTTAEDGTTTTDSNSVYTGGNTGDYTQQVISYAYIQGRWYSFPSPFAAKLAVQRYNGNMESVRTERPTGVNIDTSLGWDLEGGQLPETILPAPGVTGDALWNPPLNPIDRATPIDPKNPSVPIGDNVVGTPVDDTVVDPVVDSWTGLDQDLLNLAKRYADAGMMGRAKAAFEQAGGSWGTDTHRRMAEERDQTDRYGGDFEFDWASRGITDADALTQIKKWAAGNQYGKIKAFMEKNKSGSYDKDLHVKLAASSQPRGEERNWVAPSTVTSDTPGAYWDEIRGKWRMPAPDGTKPGGMPTSGGGGGGGGGGWDDSRNTTYDPSKMKGTREEIGGKFKTGVARQHAKTWRQTHMSAAEKKHGITRNAEGKVENKMLHGKKASKKAWDAYLAQRNKIAGRHRGMIGAGPKTLKSGKVIGW